MSSLKRIQPSGPVPARIAIVGEAPGQSEDMLGVPFVGSSGQELTRMLSEAGIDRKECYLTNVFMTRPEDNKIEKFCCKKAEADEAHKAMWGTPYPLTPLSQGKYIHPDYLFELDRLRGELTQVQPNVVIALGATASWALLEVSKISEIRGTVAPCSLAPGLKVLPTYHPAAVLRDWSMRVVTVVDLMKAKLHSQFPHLNRTRREIWLNPTLDDIAEFESTYMWKDTSIPLAVDIETAAGQITNIGFAPDTTHAINIPFVDVRRPGGSYWQDPADEIAAWKWVKSFCTKRFPKLGQNGLYDIQYLWKKMGIPLLDYTHDTMILHHAYQPELKKGLGFLGSIYTDEVAWKLMRKESNKRDE